MSETLRVPTTAEEQRIYQAGCWKLPIHASWHEILTEVTKQDTSLPFSVDLIDWINVIILVCGHDVFELEMT